MKLALKVLLPIVALVFVVVGVGAWLAVENEAAMFEADVHHDHLSLGHAVAAEAAFLDEGALAPFAARVTEQERGGVGAAPVVDIAPLGPEDRLGKTVRRGNTFVTHVPLPGADPSRATVRISEPASDLDQLRSRTWRRWLLTGSVLASLAAVAILGLGLAVLARPIRRLSAFARRIGSGDLSTDEVFEADDELGALGREMTRMCRDLDEANRRVGEEVDKRFAAVHALRHADRLGTVGQLAAGIAHELGTPLNVVQGHGQIVADEAPDEELRRSGRVIVEQVAKMTRIIRQLLDFARSRPAPRQEACPSAVAQKTLDLLRAMAKKDHIELEVGGDADAEALVAPIDEGLLGQVLANLVVNAIHASAGVGRRVEVAVRAEALAPPTGGPAAPRVVVEVRDHGTGIAPEHLEHIFEPFFTTKEVGMGTGLGLSVSYGIVQEAGGWIAVESVMGAGSVFRVVLPRVAQDAEDGSPASGRAKLGS